MITQAKNTTQEDQPELHEVYFLSVDGNELKEEPKIENRAYVSHNDYDKYGKVEVYRVGNHTRQDYFLKQFRGGRPGELLVDPYGMFARPEDLSAYTSQRGHRFCEYIQVPAMIYNSYLNYLKTRDVRYFRYAEKAILDMVK